MSEAPCATTRWLTIIGIGEDGPAGLGDEAKQLIAEAPAIFGGTRHHQLTDGISGGERFIWKSPFDASIRDILARRGTPVVVLASGDPFLYGVGATLSRHVPAEEIHCIPAPSAFSLAASRLGWPLQEVTTLSLHGRPLSLIRPHLHAGRRLLVLTSDGASPAALAALLHASGFGGSTISVLEALGGEHERLRSSHAGGFALSDINDLNICAVEVKQHGPARVLAFTPGLDDDLFEHDGQITKREIRAVTLSALAPCHGELLWDIGAGSGSVAIEWMLADPSMRAIAIEQSPQRAARIARNAEACGVPGLCLVEGEAPRVLSGLPTPDAIFVGGGGSDPGTLDEAMMALKAGGRLVANAVTLEMEAVLLAAYAEHGGELARINIARASAVGRMTGWRAAMPVTQWRWTKAKEQTS